MKNLIILYSISFLIIFSNCKKDGDNPVDAANLFYSIPLKIGNEWSYKISLSDSNGYVMLLDTVTYIIQRDTLIKNEKWFFIGTDSLAFELLTNRSDGLWYINLSDTINGKPYLMAKFPSQVNDSFLSYDSILFKVISLNYNVSVPAGNFECYYFQGIYSNGDKIDRFFPVGNLFIKDEGFNKTNFGVIYWMRELLNNKLSKENLINKKNKPVSLFFFDFDKTL